MASAVPAVIRLGKVVTLLATRTIQEVLLCKFRRKSIFDTSSGRPSSSS
jgi:hypothetical protein